MDMYTLPYLKWVTNKDPLYSTQNSAQCLVADWMGGELGGEWIYAYVWLSPFAVHLKHHNTVNWLPSKTKKVLEKIIFLGQGGFRICTLAFLTIKY